MRFPSAIGSAVVSALLFSSSALATGCPEGRGGLGVSRIVEIDATGGPVFGGITKRAREKSFLGPKEVVLTFDDGPMAGLTRSIMDTLDRFCTKATFFSVGKMAIAYPETVREILRRGHTLGTHTWSHPMNLPRLKGQQAIDQIESGFAAVSLAAGQPIAPFFRFPGLNDSDALVAHLAQRGIATFTVDVVSNDSYISDPSRVIDRTLAQLQAENGGIALFHDIKPQTARALPALLSEMKARGYRIVHLRAKEPFQRDDRYAEAVRQQVAQRNPTAMRALLAVTDVPDAPQPAVLPPDQQLADAMPKPVLAALPISPLLQPGMVAIAEVERRAPTPPATAPDAPATVSEPEASVAASDAKAVLKPVRERKVKVARAAEPKLAPAQAQGLVSASRPAQAIAKPAIEVVAGAYLPAQPRSSPGGIPPPEVIAGAYSQQRPVQALPRAIEKPWSETFRDRQRETGN